jgi:acetylornithine deacetylase/succinyl-diaminopimelate desuccinylase-like protein
MARLGKTARRLLRADVLLSCDALKAVPGIPTITLGLRGLVTLTAVLRGPRRDLHSGVHGGKAPNPALGLARLLASLHHPDGSVAVPGFYDGVAAPTAEERSLINAVPFSAAQYKRLTGVEAVGGEHGYTPAERAGLRPALDVNGLSGGYADAGCKTIIPASATAKLSARLVAGQHLRRCLERIVRHLERHTPRGLRLDISERHVAGPAVRLRLDSPWVRLARDILRQVTGRAPLLHWEGASIPVMAQLPALAGAELLLVGFGEERDNIHAPNESFSRAQFRQGYRFVARFLQAAGGG